MSNSLDDLSDELRPAAYEFIREVGAAGLQPRITSTRRSGSEQSRLYSDFLAGRSRFPAAPPGASAHEYGWAFDLVVEPFEYLTIVGKYWIQAYGGEWGARSDPVHFQLPGAKQAAQEMLRSKLAASVDPNTPWLYRQGALPKWLEDALGFIPGISLVSDLVSALGIK